MATTSSSSPVAKGENGRHIGSLIGPKPADAAVMRLVSELKRAGAVTVSGDAVSYPGL